MEIKPIGYIKNDFKDKFAIPRQSGIADCIKSKIILEGEYKNALNGIEGFSHIWLIWGFSQNQRDKHSMTVRPPRLGGNTRVGVFASRSPFRPNNLGLSSVRLIEVNNGELIVTGADLMDSTPIYDIKPYIKFTDCHEDAICGYVDETEFHRLNVIDNGLLNNLDKSIYKILENDPRPAYQDDESRIYGFKFAQYEIKFKVNGDDLTVVSVEKSLTDF